MPVKKTMKISDERNVKGKIRNINQQDHYQALNFLTNLLNKQLENKFKLNEQQFDIDELKAMNKLYYVENKEIQVIINEQKSLIKFSKRKLPRIQDEQKINKKKISQKIKISQKDTDSDIYIADQQMIEQTIQNQNINNTFLNVQFEQCSEQIIEKWNEQEQNNKIPNQDNNYPNDDQELSNQTDQNDNNYDSLLQRLKFDLENDVNHSKFTNNDDRQSITRLLDDYQSQRVLLDDFEPDEFTIKIFFSDQNASLRISYIQVYEFMSKYYEKASVQSFPVKNNANDYFVMQLVHHNICIIIWSNQIGYKSYTSQMEDQLLDIMRKNLKYIQEEIQIEQKLISIQGK